MRAFFYIFALLTLMLHTELYAQPENANTRQESVFIQNMGQVVDFDQQPRNEFLYYINTPSLDIYFRKEGITYIFKKGESFPETAGLMPVEQEKRIKEYLNKESLFFRLDMDFKNAESGIDINGEGKSGHYRNFYFAHCPQGIMNVSSYQKIIYKNVYPNIDLAFYLKDGKFKYDILVHPGGDINAVCFEFNKASEITLDENILTLKTPVGDIKESLPKSFLKDAQGKENEEEVFYTLSGNRVQFRSDYNPDQLLVIDPEISWTTYYDDCFWNGLGSSIDVKGTQCVISSYGFNSLFPTLNPGGSAYYQSSNAGSGDYRILKFDTDGVLIWATYYGGTGYDNISTIKIDYAGNVILAGHTESSDIPCQSAGGYYDATYNAGTFSGGTFIAKFNSSGVRQWATHYDYVSYPFVEVDLNNNVYVLGRAEYNDPPVLSLAGAYNQALVSHDAGGTNHSADIFIVKFNSSTSRLWATNLGSTTDEFVQDVKCSADNYLNILGYSDCYSGTGLVTYNPGGGAYYDNSVGPSATDRDDALLYRFNTAGALVWGTAFGGSLSENIQQGRLTTDQSNNIFIYGETRSTNLPCTNPGGGAYYDNVFTASGSGFNPFLARFTSAGVLNWCTYFGSYGLGFGMNFSNYLGINTDNNLIVLATDGGGAGGTFPLVPRVGDYNATLAVYMGVYIAEFASNLSIAWSTYYAGTTDRHTLGDAALSSNSCGYEIYMTSRWEKYNVAAIDPPWVKPIPASYQNTVFFTSGNESGLISRFSVIPSVAPTGINASPPTLCAGDSTTLTVVGGSLGTGANWEWYSGSCGGTSVGSGSSITVAPGSTITFYVRAEGTCNTTTCASLAVTVGANSTAATSMLASLNPICPGESTTLSLSGGSLGTGAAWQWYTGSCGGTLVGTGSTLLVSPSATTTYYARAEGSCDTTACVSITVNLSTLSTTPSSISAVTNPICLNDNTNLSVSGGSLGTGASWMWYTGSCGGTAAGTGTTINVSPLANTTYYVQAIGSCNTTSCVSLILSVTDVAADAGSGQTICNGDTATLTATGNGSFLWSYMSLTTASISVAPLSTTTYTVTVTSGSCSQSDAVTVTVTGQADATITSAGPYCSGDAPFTLSAVDPGGSWSGTGISNPSTGLFDPSLAGAGTFQIVYSISGSCGDTDTAYLTVINSADATINSAGPFCTGETATNLSAANSGGIWAGTGITNATSGTFDPAAAGSGNFMITYTFSGSCGDSDTIYIDVNASENASINPAGPFCVSDTIQTLMAVDTGGNWSGTGITNNLLGLFDPATAGVGTHVITYGIPGVCGDTSSISITVDSVFDVSITSADLYCNNIAPVGLIAATSGGVWSGPGITDPVNGTFNPAGLGAGTYTIIYTISGNCGAADTAAIEIALAPEGTMNTTAESCIGQADGTAGFTVNGGTPPFVYLWDNSETTASITGLAPGMYVLMINDSNLCSLTDTAWIAASTEDCETIIPVIYIPNVFSPNDDNYNDILFVRGQGIADFTLIIYDRWGEKIFETSELNSGWDGTFRGKKMDRAVFVYTLDGTFLNDESFHKKGNITLVR